MTRLPSGFAQRLDKRVDRVNKVYDEIRRKVLEGGHLSRVEGTFIDLWYLLQTRDAEQVTWLRRHKVTVLAVLVLVVLPFSVALWFMYGWMFFDMPAGELQWDKTAAALVLTCVGFLLSAGVYTLETRR